MSCAGVSRQLLLTSDDAGDVWDAFQGKGEPLYQVQTVVNQIPIASTEAASAAALVGANPEPSYLSLDVLDLPLN